MRASVTLSHPWTCSLSTPPIASLAPTFSSADDGDDDGGDGDGVDKWAMRCGAIDAATAWRPTSTADWAMASTVWPAWAAWIVVGLSRKDSASDFISAGMVAEKNTVWQADGNVSKIRLMAG